MPQSMNGAGNGAGPRVAVVGVGYWGRNLARNFATLHALGLLCDEQAAAERHCRAEHDGVPFSQTYDDVLRDRSIDAVVRRHPRRHPPASPAPPSSRGQGCPRREAAGPRRRPGGAVGRAGARGSGRVLMVGHVARVPPRGRGACRQLVRGRRAGPASATLYSNRLNFGKMRTEENILWSFAPHDISVILLRCSDDDADSRSACHGGAYLSNRDVADVTVMSQFDLPQRGPGPHVRELAPPLQGAAARRRRIDAHGGVRRHRRPQAGALPAQGRLDQPCPDGGQRGATSSWRSIARAAAPPSASTSSSACGRAGPR